MQSTDSTREGGKEPLPSPPKKNSETDEISQNDNLKRGQCPVKVLQNSQCVSSEGWIPPAGTENSTIMDLQQNR